MTELRVKRSIVLVLSFAGLLAAALLASCSERCDPGYHLERHICYADPVSDAAGAAGASGAPGELSCDEPSVSTFRAPCMSHTDCVCDSDFCTARPTQTGFCTRTGCDTDPSVCPSGYDCTDLSVFGAGLPSICTPP